MSFRPVILPVTKALSRSSSHYVPLKDDGEVQQYGRSSTYLAAEAASANICNELLEYSRKSDRIPSRPVSMSKVSFKSHDGHILVTLDTCPQLAPLPRQTSLAASVPSLLSPISATKPYKSRGHRSSRFRSPRSSARKTIGNEESRASLLGTTDDPQSQPALLLRKRGRENFKTIGSPNHGHSPTRIRSHMPTRFSQLGLDYSRYPAPEVVQEHLISESAALPSNDGPKEKTKSNELHLNHGGTNTLPTGKRKTNNSNLSFGSVDIDEKGFFPYLDDRIGAPSIAEHGYNFPMYLDEKERDDDFHIPCPDDDVRLKPKFRDYFVRGQLCSLFALILMFIGLIVVFIIFPVLCYVGVVQYHYQYDTPLKELAPSNINAFAWDYVNGRNYSLLHNVRTGLIDSTTPQYAMTRTALDGSQLELVFSDEFNDPGRSFYPGDDPFWTAQDMWYGSTQDLEWYDPDAVTTADGTLALELDSFTNHNLSFRSGMLNSWNQLCFKGGVLEVSISLAGPAGIQGLWPGAWTMGNLGRPGYRASTDGTWPYTYDSCDAGITPNQSSTDGLSYLPGQKLPSCTCAGEDHPTPGKGRGAPEIDVLEVSANEQVKLGTASQSYQVAPFDIWYHPNYDFMAIANDNVTTMNTYCGGSTQQAISGITTLNNGWYDGQNYQKYAFEYTPGTGPDSSIAWFVGDEMTWMMTGDAISPNGNIAQRLISEEPMAVVLNLGISNSWTWIDWANLKFPATMHVDYVRWYQKPGQVSVTCDPPGYETTEYIAKHPKAYQNANLTVCLCRLLSDESQLIASIDLG